jgi:hypothetical protein
MYLLVSIQLDHHQADLVMHLSLLDFVLTWINISDFIDKNIVINFGTQVLKNIKTLLFISLL